MRGFILQPTYRLQNGKPEVHLYGTRDDGASFCVVDDRVRPYFFVPAARADEVRTLGVDVSPTELRSFDGELVARVETAVPADVPPLRQRLGIRGITCFEADLRFAYRYLIDRGLRAAIEIDGEPIRGGDAASRFGDIAYVYRNPTLRPAHFVPQLKVLSLDIETDLRARHLYAIGLAGLGADRVLIVGPGPLRGAECFATERELLLRFFALLRELDPDVLTGWNVIDFDLTVLRTLCARYGIPFRLGRTADETLIQRDQGFTRDPRAIAPGRQVLDGLALTRSAFIRLDDYKLETAAQAFLGRGKLMTGEGRGTEIEHAFRHDRQRLVDYNQRDAVLALEIVAARRLVELAVSRSLLTGMQLVRVGASIASVDFLYLHELRRRGYVAPSVGGDYAGAEVAGGAVLDSVPGLFRNILVFDFKSLYPSIIRTFNIDPLTYVPPERRDGDVELIRTPGGAAFRREPGILPELVATLWRERDAARAANDPLAAYAIKILMNSLYGVLAATSCRFFSPAVANAITHTGQYLIHLAADEVRRLGHAVIYGDTDSLFVDAAAEDPGLALQRAEEIRVAVSAMLVRRLREEFGLASYLELEFEKCYGRFFMPEVRSGAAGSKKRYAGLVAGDSEVVEFVGLEAVRRDWTPLAKRFQRELLDRVFHDQPVEDFIRAFLADLRDGRLDELLSYKKAVRKRLAEYTSTTPAHVKAARKQQGAERQRIVEYVMTTAGPEPVDTRRGALDYRHYVDKQIEPIADAVLRFLSIRFGDVIGRARQLELL